ncbi:alpha/beta fold hydrolase [Falsihalocynthiibacter sp. SS001]|uniref:alpha/beta fold hydrolase n=1 Tax=Falsihalocynthiibacter sp. SS001 TaxID=3349698 RepID=UPI0036D3F9A4
MSNFYQSSDGLSLHYLDEGEGIPIICLAGLTRSARDFDFVAPHLGDVRLIRPDYRGRGQSDWADPSTYTVATEAADILALMNHLSTEKAAILGTSRGGLIAMVIAAMAKERLLGVCLNDIGPVISAEGLEVIAAYIGRRPSQKTYNEAAAARAFIMSEFKNVPESRWLEEARALYVETENGLELRYDPKLREAVLASAKQPTPDLWPYFDALSGLPTALLRGENSDLLSRETAQEMCRRRPDMLFTEVADRGHIPFLDEPESLRLIQAWIQEMT